MTLSVKVKPHYSRRLYKHGYRYKIEKNVNFKNVSLKLRESILYAPLSSLLILSRIWSTLYKRHGEVTKSSEQMMLLQLSIEYVNM